MQPQKSRHDLSGRRQNRRGYDRRRRWLLMRRTHSPRWNRSELSVDPLEQMMGPGICGHGPSAVRRNLNSFAQKRLHRKTGQEPRLTASAEAAEHPNSSKGASDLCKSNSRKLVGCALPLLSGLHLKQSLSRVPVGIVSLKNRTISPLAELFINSAREPTLATLSIRPTI
jgi:hypothetical protein